MTTIWDDPQVQAIFDVQDGRPYLRLPELTDADRALLERYAVADNEAMGDAPANAYVAACVTGLCAVEDFTLAVGEGWYRFVAYGVANNAHILWDSFQAATEARVFSEWFGATAQRHSWGADGGTSAIGRQVSNCLNIAARTGGGVQLNPQTKKFEAPNGDAARQYAAEWKRRNGSADHV